MSVSDEIVSVGFEIVSVSVEIVARTEGQRASEGEGQCGGGVGGGGRGGEEERGAERGSGREMEGESWACASLVFAASPIATD